ncbi:MULTISPECIES: transposase [unclassified Microcoleus]|uniref:transposase n=1 Tax=unclassified Microcoleus TaxID=2642155 RepID=UPI0040406F35
MRLPKGWTVERTYGWFHCSRRRNVDSERLPASSKALIHIAMIRRMLRRLAWAFLSLSVFSNIL